MRERPILFSGAMVRALLDGTKTQTRRVVKPVGNDDSFVLQDHGGGWWPYRSDDGESPLKDGNEIPHACPYGQPGDRLWVRETFEKIEGQTQPWIETDYRATYTHGDRMGDHLGLKKRWTPAIHMPRAASRITLEVTGVRVERLADISEADAIAEGIGSIQVGSEGESRWINYLDPESKAAAFGDPRRSYWTLWEQINGRASVDANPWVWVIEFRRAA